MAKTELSTVCEKCGTKRPAFGCTYFIENEGIDMTLCPLCADELSDLLSDARCKVVSKFKKECYGKKANHKVR